jgi:transposase InsO family protein
MSIYARSKRPVLPRSIEPAQYTSYDFAKACRTARVERSMGTVGDCYDCDDVGVLSGVA